MVAQVGLTLYLTETPFTQNQISQLLKKLHDQGFLCLPFDINVENVISDLTLVDLTGNFFVLCTRVIFNIIIQSGRSLALILMREMVKELYFACVINKCCNIYLLRWPLY